MLIERPILFRRAPQQLDFFGVKEALCQNIACLVILAGFAI
jgi:hypothetical protein